MAIRKPYLLLLIPLVLAVLAVAGYGFFFKAAVPGTCAIILVFLFRKQLKEHTDILFVAGAFLFSIAGDAFLSHKGDSFLLFAAGIGLYLLAHLGYLCFALRNGRIQVPFTIVLLTGFLLFFFFRLYPAIDDTILLLAVLIYLLVSCLSLGAAFGIKLAPLVKWSYFAGVTLVLLSDTIISLNEFTGYTALNFLILPTYYGAHILISFALIKKMEKHI